jgi:hypothetical protein
MEQNLTFQASVVSTFNVKIGGDHYTTYKIRVVPYDSQDNCDLIYVNKRYNDFGELYDDLKKTHKNIREFEFPEKKAIGKLDAAVVQKRVDKFNEFLAEITKYDTISKDPRVLSFLNISAKDKPYVRVSVLECLNLNDYTRDSIVYPFFEIYCCKDLVGRQKIGKSDYTASGKESDSNFKNDEFTIPLLDNEVQGIRINLWDKKSSTKKAFVNIPLNSIPFNAKVEHWFIFNEIDKQVNAAGLLKLRLFYHNPNGLGPFLQELLPTDEITVAAKKRPPIDDSSKPKTGELRLGFKYIPPKGPWSGSITIHVKEAKDLQAAGHCDPCVALSYLRSRKCTETKKSTQNPTFDQKFQYPLNFTQVSQFDFGSLEISVYNMAGGGDRKLIGSASVKFEDFLPLIERPGEEYDVEGTVLLHKD